MKKTLFKSIFCIFLLKFFLLNSYAFKIMTQEQLYGNWYFHTGQGYTELEYYDDQTKTFKHITSNCELEFYEDECFEKIYLFTDTEIDLYIQNTLELIQQKIYTHTTGAALAGTFLVSSSKSLITTLSSPDLTASKLVTFGSGIIAAISGIMVTWETMNIVELYNKMNHIYDLLNEQRVFIQRCGHPKKDFLMKASKLGIKIFFHEYSGVYLSSKSSKKKSVDELRLYDDTLIYAQINSISLKESYEEYFLNQCSQVPSVYDQKIDLLFQEKVPHFFEEQHQNKAKKQLKSVNL